MSSLTGGEVKYCEAIREKVWPFEAFLSGSALSENIDARRWLTHLIGIKSALGNLNNDLGFIATLLVKSYLAERFAIVDFDAAGKPQGASGEDIVATTADGRKIIGELKTTKPYQPGFGAAQRTAMLKDLWQVSDIERRLSPYVCYRCGRFRGTV